MGWGGVAMHHTVSCPIVLKSFPLHTISAGDVKGSARLGVSSSWQQMGQSPKPPDSNLALTPPVGRTSLGCFSVTSGWTGFHAPGERPGWQQALGDGPWQIAVIRSTVCPGKEMVNQKSQPVLHNSFAWLKDLTQVIMKNNEKTSSLLILVRCKTNPSL